MQAENIYNRLGEDLNKWQALLVQIRKARGTFDNAETKKEFGPVVIDYGKVRVSLLLPDLDRDAVGPPQNRGQKGEGNLWCLFSLQVQSKVNLKYDSWHKEVLSKFGQMLGTNMTEFHSQISKVRPGQLLPPSPSPILGPLPLLDTVALPTVPSRAGAALSGHG